MFKMDFTFRELEIFCKVVQLGSFSKAAEAVFLAQASVSERIASLENKIGARLLDRLSRKVIPTEIGDLFYKQALLLLEMKQNTQEEIQSFLGLEQGEISIGCSTIPGEYILPKYISRFNKKHPHLTVKLDISDSLSIEKEVLAGKYEIGIIGLKSDQKNIVSQKLWQDELVLAVSKNHPLGKQKNIDEHKLKNLPWILREQGSGTLKVLESYLQNKGHCDFKTMPITARLGSSTAIKEAIKAGLGISALSKRALALEEQTGIIKILRIKNISMTRNFYLIQNKLRSSSPACRAMRDFLISSANKEQ